MATLEHVSAADAFKRGGADGFPDGTFSLARSIHAESSELLRVITPKVISLRGYLHVTALDVYSIHPETTRRRPDRQYLGQENTRGGKVRASGAQMEVLLKPNR
jgi:hypothetical protein